MKDKMTVREVSNLTGVSIRTLHYYDEIGLLTPSEITEAGYRLYDDEALYRLQLILLFKAMEFPLKEIKDILARPDSERNAALAQQITLLEMKREHLDNLITLARGIKAIGVRNLDFTAFDTRKIDEYERQAKANWGQTAEYKEYEQKSAGRTPEDHQKLSVEFMAILARFGSMQGFNPSDEAVREQVRVLQDYISEHFYTCSDEILLCLGRMYAGGGSMTEGIDKAGGKGTADFAFKAIEAYVASRH